MLPKGCPSGYDPVEVCRELAQRSIVLYTVGCEPNAKAYRDLYMALAHITGGQYVPLRMADLLSQVILGGAREELSLQLLQEDVDEEVEHMLEERHLDSQLDYEALASRVMLKLQETG